MPTPAPPLPEDDDLDLVTLSTTADPEAWEPWRDPNLFTLSLGRLPSTPLFAVSVEALLDMLGHGSTETGREVGGILLGRFVHTSQGVGTRIEDILIADSAEASLTHVTFTHESWSQIHRQLDQRDDGVRIVGWYHTHPGFGPFLSGQDLFIQRNFFNHPLHAALVLDPVRHSLAVFGWCGGEIVKGNGLYLYGPLDQKSEAEYLQKSLAYSGDPPKHRDLGLRKWLRL